MNETGTKLTCPTCGAEVVVTKGGEGKVVCHGEEMVVAAGAGAAQRSGEVAEDDPFYD